MISAPFAAWWVIEHAELRSALQRAAEGENLDLLITELFANSETATEGDRDE